VFAPAILSKSPNNLTVFKTTKMKLMHNFIRRLFGICFLICVCLTSRADARIEGVFALEHGKEISIEVKEILPISSTVDPLTAKADITDSRSFSMNLKIKKPGLFNVFIIIGEGDNKAPYNTVIYLAPKTVLKLEFLHNEAKPISCNFTTIKDPNNRSLVMMQERFNQLMKNSFYNPPSNEIQAKAYLDSFFLEADSLLAQRALKPLVKKYIQMNTAQTFQSNLYNYANLFTRDMLFSDAYYNLAAKIIPGYKDPFMLVFPSGIQNLVGYLNLKTGLKPYASIKTLEQIENQINLLQEQGFNKTINDKTIEWLLGQHVNRYKAAENFEKDKTIFFKLADYIADTKKASVVKETFSNLKFTLKGAPLPPVKLMDRDGNVVTLDQFRGKYIFIDLWASWCVPCIKMTPYVQQLEKNFKGKYIVFINISIDANKASWLRKMDELKMEGHQFWDPQSELTKKLNISGIPHYLIYDPAGNLIIYKTEMPDSPKLKQTIEGLMGNEG
jgi:thiol-disulfide isomerase/thioredoxin